MRISWNYSLIRTIRINQPWIRPRPFDQSNIHHRIYHYRDIDDFPKSYRASLILNHLNWNWSKSLFAFDSTLEFSCGIELSMNNFRCIFENIKRWPLYKSSWLIQVFMCIRFYWIGQAMCLNKMSRATKTTWSRN